VAYLPKTSSKFNRVKKKFPVDLRKAVDDVVRRVCEDPSVGDLKTGTLSGVRVHKFGCLGQVYLLAYEPCQEEGVVYIYPVGGHENFYRDLQHYLKS